MNFAQDGSRTSQNYWGIGAVILLHIVLIYALVAGLARKVVDIIRPPAELQIVQEIIPPKPPEPPKLIKPKTPTPPPKIQPTFVPKAEVKVAETPVPVIAAVTNTPTPPPPPVVAQPEPKPVHVSVSTSSRSGCSAPKYPEASIDNEESGTVTLALLINEDGKVIDSKIDKTSGFKALDWAAQKALSLCTFKPASTDGKPEKSWTKLQYVWKLSD